MSKLSGMRKVRVAGPGKLLGLPLYGCPGCHHPLVVRILADLLEEMKLGGTAIHVPGVGCIGTGLGLGVDVVHGTHGGAPDIATAIKRLSPGSFVFTVQGDGDCVAIGAGALVGALSRAEKITIVMLNNTLYGTTSGQMSPTTLIGQKTTTTPDGRTGDNEGYPIHAAEMVAGFRGVAYSARGALNTPANYQRTRKYMKTAFQKQLDGAGLSFVEVLSACPANWHLSPVEALEWVETRMIPEFPLGEFKNVERAG